MNTLGISSISTEYILVPVFAKVDGLQYNPSGDIVQMAFVAPDTKPGIGDWHSASWEVEILPGITNFYVRCLVGPDGGVSLAPGTYDMWVFVQDSPESPKRMVGRIVIT